MMPDADIVALSTSVSNHWSRKSTALIVMSWTWLYWSSGESFWKRRAEAQQVREAFQVERGRVGRGHREDRLDEPAHLDHRLAVLVVGLGVDLRVPRDLAARLVVVVDAPEVVAARHRGERAVQRQDLEAVARQVELADDLGAQQRHDVRADGELETGEDLLGHRGAAEHVAALEDEDLLARLAPGRPRDETVVAAADDDDVVGRFDSDSGHCSGDGAYL